MGEEVEKKHKLRGVIRFLTDTCDKPQIKLGDAATLFGREKGDILLHDNEVSSTHCQIQPMKDEYYIFDMHSSNGTYVNGKKIMKEKLNNGDKISIGQTVFQFSIEEEDKVRNIRTAFHASKTSITEQTKPKVIDTLIEKNKKKSWILELSIIYISKKTEKIQLKQNLVYLGRECSFGEFEIDPKISRKHLMIKVNEEGDIFVEDQNSLNGSFLNEKPITGLHKIRQDDKLRIGSTYIQCATIEKP